MENDGQFIIVEVGKAALKGTQSCLELFVCVGTGYDGNVDAFDRITKASDLRGISRTKTSSAGKRKARDAFEDGALSGGLVTDDGKLLKLVI